MACTKLFVGSANRLLHRLPCVTVTSAFSTSASFHKDSNYQLLIIGGGTGGAAVANKFARRLGKGAVGVIEPKDVHYYQPMWTLVGAGVKQLEQSARPMDWVLPSDADWIQDSVASFDPDNNTVTTAQGDNITYEHLVVAMGIQLNYNQVKGLEEALEKDPMVCSNYKNTYVTKTHPAMKKIEGGDIIFTFPNTPIKCPGAPQKIVYLTEHFLRKNGKRSKSKITYNTSLAVLFGVKKYADSLWEIVKSRDINVNLRTNLVEVNHKRKEAIFENLDTNERHTMLYSFLHAPPPMSSPDVLKNCKLVDEAGYVAVNKNTLQSTKYPNVFAIGDCSNVPTSKTAAACAAQALALQRTLLGRLKNNDSFKGTYDGYTSCPLITQYGKCIMAEFGFDGQVMETFPLNQGIERTSMYYMKTEFMPQLYFYGLVKGFWNGPRTLRKMIHLGLNKV